MLDRGVSEFSPNEPLGVVHRAGGIRSRLVLRSIANQALATVRKRHVTGRDAIALVVRADFHSPVAPDTDTRVRSAEVNADAGRGHG
mmetsp:Transcript_10110/g.28816  ORF Transcript_10110/g.28816 Transcript_10110/m.28816 type:complete len:87 (+) Transcript_10110:1847-2107(+)